MQRGKKKGTRERSRVPGVAGGSPGELTEDTAKTEKRLKSTSGQGVRLDEDTWMKC